MQSNQPSSWGRRIAGALVLLIVIAVAARFIYELLDPLLPALLALLLLTAAALVIFRRGLG